MDLESLLESFCRTFGFPPVPVEASGQARLCFSGDLNVDLEWRPGQDGLHLTGVVCAGVPDDPRLLRSLLQANAPRVAAWRTVLSLDPADGALVVSVLLPQAILTETTLAQALEEVLETMESWRHDLGDGAVSHPDTAEPQETAPRPSAGWNIRA